MGLFDGMKERLGFGAQPEWQDEGAYDDGYDDGYYDDGGYEPIEEDDYVQPSGDVVSFDAYNPDTFRNVSVSTDAEPRVAHGYGSSRTSERSGYASRIGTSSRRSSGASAAGVAGATWDTPEDPSFLEERPSISERSREVLDQIGATHSGSAGDPYSQFDSDVRRIGNDPAAHLEVVTPKVYGDVEKVATAAKAGKSVVLELSGTKPELAKRILDFSFGVASALNKNVDKAADKVFVISKGSEMLSEEEREYLVKKGVL